VLATCWTRYAVVVAPFARVAPPKEQEETESRQVGFTYESLPSMTPLVQVLSEAMLVHDPDETEALE
jgi:hypothetical protein